MWKKHPKALPFLFFSEMWERFGYYLMIGIFTLYLKHATQGFNMNESESASLYGTFIGLVFFTPFLGGLLADRYLGLRRSVIIGGLMMGAGYCLMAVHSVAALYLAMTLVILGNGFFKPNISTLLGNVYTTPQHNHQKDEGYNIFYMGINIGAFICNFVAAILYNYYGYPAAFISAGIGMFVGVVIFISGNKHYAGYDLIKKPKAGEMSIGRISLICFVPAIIAGIIGWFIPGKIFDSDATDAFIFACVPVAIFYMILWLQSEPEFKRPMGALLTIFAVVILFWAVFKQNGTALTTWADNYTDRQVSGTAETVFNKIYLSKQLEYKKDSVPMTTPQFAKVKLDGKVVNEYNYPVYFKNVPPSQLPQDGGKISLWATNLSQSINPGWVILLTPLIIAFFTWLRRKGKEPSTPTKITLGLFISALSVLVMILAVKAGGNGAEKVSVLWLIGSYGVITIGELLLSPMGLSIVSKLSPPRITALMMGGWFLSTSIGNKLSGVLASKWDQYTNKASYFWLNFFLLLAAAFLLLLFLKQLNKIMKEKGVN